MEQVLQIIMGMVIMPITQWIKTKLPGDFPPSPMLISYALSIVATYGIAYIYAPTMPLADIITQALAITGTAAQATHAVVKMVKTGEPK